MPMMGWAFPPEHLRPCRLEFLLIFKMIFIVTYYLPHLMDVSSSLIIFMPQKLTQFYLPTYFEISYILRDFLLTKRFFIKVQSSSNIFISTVTPCTFSCRDMFRKNYESFHKAFEQMDTNKDGLISRADLMKVLFEHHFYMSDDELVVLLNRYACFACIFAGVREFSWMCVNLHGCAWIRMNFHGIAWICVDFREFAWMCVDLREPVWISENLHSFNVFLVLIFKP